MKINNKAFTLIELLAVLMILGAIITIALPSMTRYIDNSKKDTMSTSASYYINDGADLFTSYNVLPIPGSCTYILVDNIVLEKGGSSPYNNIKYSDAVNKDGNKSFVRVTNKNGDYEYDIYLTDGTTSLIGTREQIEGSPEIKRSLIKLDTEITNPEDRTPILKGSDPEVTCRNLTVPE